MCSHSKPNWIAFLLLICSSPWVVAADEDDRREWHYRVPAGLRRIVDEGGERWVLHFPNGTTAEMVEMKRTAEYVQLQNSDNQNVLRLFADHGTIQKGGTGPFRRFTAGAWVAPQTSSIAETDYLVRVVYFVPTDRRPTSDYEAKIQVIVELIAEIMTRDLQSKGYETEGPQFVRRDGKIVVDLLRGQKTSLDYNQGAAWKSSAHGGAIFDEVNQRHGSTRYQMTLIFAETYEYGTAPRLWPGHIALAAAQPPRGGVGVMSAWILRDEFATADPVELRRRFFDESPYPGRTALGHRGPNSPRADFLEDGIGGALHELAHMFGATHHSRGAPNNIMGQGFRNLRWNVSARKNRRLQARFSKESAWMLMSSRYLNPLVDRTDNVRPTADLQLQQQRNRVAATIQVADNRALRLLVVVEVTAEEGRQIMEARELEGTEQSLQLRLTPKRAGGPTKIQLIVVDAGGNHQKITKSLSGRK